MEDGIHSGDRTNGDNHGTDKDHNEGSEVVEGTKPNYTKEFLAAAAQAGMTEELVAKMCSKDLSIHSIECFLIDNAPHMKYIFSSPKTFTYTDTILGNDFVYTITSNNELHIDIAHNELKYISASRYESTDYVLTSLPAPFKEIGINSVDNSLSYIHTTRSLSGTEDWVEDYAESRLTTVNQNKMDLVIAFAQAENVNLWTATVNATIAGSTQSKEINWPWRYLGQGSFYLDYSITGKPQDGMGEAIAETIMLTWTGETKPPFEYDYINCVSCHNTNSAISHMQSNGMDMDNPDIDIMSCAVCHGENTSYDAAKYH